MTTSYEYWTFAITPMFVGLLPLVVKKCLQMSNARPSDCARDGLDCGQYSIHQLRKVTRGRRVFPLFGQQPSRQGHAVSVNPFRRHLRYLLRLFEGNTVTWNLCSQYFVHLRRLLLALLFTSQGEGCSRNKSISIIAVIIFTCCTSILLLLLLCFEVK